jgi:hypothetical protein
LDKQLLSCLGETVGLYDRLLADGKDLPPELLAAIRNLVGTFEATHARIATDVKTTTSEQSRIKALLSHRLVDYKLHGFLGRGGMGEVWLAEHPTLGRRVAIKLLSSSVIGEPGFTDRFRREAQILARMDHPNLTKIYDYGESDGECFLVMEYHPGNLRDYMRYGPPPLAQTLQLMILLCDAVQAAHDAGVIHRDLKPENVLVNASGLKLTDFGIARPAREPNTDMGQGPADRGAGLTQAGAVVGTPAYMAPEQWQAPETIDGRTDVYALGLVLYELLTGLRPRGRCTPPSTVCRDVRLDRIVAKALASKPEDRYPRVKDLGDDLRAVQARPRRLAMLLDGAGVLAVVLAIVWLTSMVLRGHSVACHALFLLFTLISTSTLFLDTIFVLSGGFQHPIHLGDYWHWLRRPTAGAAAVACLLFDLTGPVLGAAILPAGGWRGWDVLGFIYTVCYGSCFVLLTLAGPVAKRTKWTWPYWLAAAGILVVTGLGVAGYWVEALGRWMPLVLATLALSWWYPRRLRDTREPPAPVVASPFDS